MKLVRKRQRQEFSAIFPFTFTYSYTSTNKPCWQNVAFDLVSYNRRLLDVFLSWSL